MAEDPVEEKMSDGLGIVGDGETSCSRQLEDHEGHPAGLATGARMSTSLSFCGSR